MDKDRIDKVRAKFCSAYRSHLEITAQEFCDHDLKMGTKPGTGSGMNPELLLILLTRLGLRGVERMVEVVGASAVVSLLQQEMQLAMAELTLVDPEFGQVIGEEILGSLRDQLNKEMAERGGEEGWKQAALGETERRASKPKPAKAREPAKQEKGFGQLATALKKAGVVS